MIFLRSLLFNIFFFVWAFVPTLVLVWIVYLPKKQLFFWIRAWQKGMGLLEKYVAGIDYKVIGWEHLPEGPCIIAAKHQSAWETCKLHVLFGDPAIVLKKELTQVPIWGAYARASDMIPVDRKGGGRALALMMKAAKDARAAGRRIVIFPQGTRVRVGDKVDYKVGVGALYAALDLPVVPMALNSGLFWPKGKFFKKPGTITVEFLPPIPAKLPRGEFMKRLETELEAASDRLAENP